MARKKKEIERIAQDRFDPEAIDFSKPIDITKFGSDDDPCFGKHFDMTTKQCKVCGDAQFCQIKTGQNQHLLRDGKSKEKEYLDYNPENNELTTSNELECDVTTKKRVVRFMKRKIAKGVKPIKIRKLAIEKYEISKSDSKIIFNKIKK